MSERGNDLCDENSVYHSITSYYLFKKACSLARSDTCTVPAYGTESRIAAKWYLLFTICYICYVYIYFKQSNHLTTTILLLLRRSEEHSLNSSHLKLSRMPSSA